MKCPKPEVVFVVVEQNFACPQGSVCQVSNRTACLAGMCSSQYSAACVGKSLCTSAKEVLFYSAFVRLSVSNLTKKTTLRIFVKILAEIYLYTKKN